MYSKKAKPCLRLERVDNEEESGCDEGRCAVCDTALGKGEGGESEARCLRTPGTPAPLIVGAPQVSQVSTFGPPQGQIYL